jgi:hypothetical protein
VNLPYFFTYLLLWGTIGCIIFFLIVLLFFRTGIVYTARKPDGTLKEDIPISARLAMLILPIGFLIFQLISNYFGLVFRDLKLSFVNLFLLNFLIYTILFMFDTVFIDGFVLSIWRPNFLELPDEMGKESMQKHILISIPIGIVIGLVLTLISTTISYGLWMTK